MATRKEIADGLKRATCSYFLRNGFSCHVEIAVSKWGKLKADVLAVNLKSELILAEVKSCPQDFRKDNKWQNYLPASNRMYFIFTEHTTQVLKDQFDLFKTLGCGVLTLDSKTGYLRCTLPAKARKMSGSMKKYLITRLAWRTGDFSKRNSRRSRIFL